MDIQEYINYRDDLLDETRDEEGFISESSLINAVLPAMSDAKLIDSDDYSDAFFCNYPENIKINGYKFNESEERLQLFIVNESSLFPNATPEDLLISQKAHYDALFAKAIKFIRKSTRRHLIDDVQEAHPAKSLINFLSSVKGIEQIDVIEIFLISATATVEIRGASPQPKQIDFEEELLKVLITKADRTSVEKKISIYKRLIDLNFLFNVLISQGNREILEVDFVSLFGEGIQAIRAADEQHFESYLCVLPAPMLADLYKRYSTRMLEKNVRSFLQFKGVNQGIRDTIRKTPEYFIAYNNGLTVTAVGAITEQKGELTQISSLKDFQIVNGGQTTASIYFSQKDGLDISKIKIMAKVNIAKNAGEEDLNELISNISKFSNAQSKVSNADLRSRNEQLIRIKVMSESTLTPSGKKWFFERFKGEFDTLQRKNPRSKARLNSEFPKKRRFSKEGLAKYYMSWGGQPYLVKKGGDKVFRIFIEEISGTGGGKAPVIDRDFFEAMIARVILFRELEDIYGDGRNAIGQLRSAVVPYTISVLHNFTSESRTGNGFDLQKIWQREGLEKDIRSMLTDLMKLMNELIKKYAASDDYGEFSKRKELWDLIIQSTELKEFIRSNTFQDAVKKYLMTKEDLQKRQHRKTKFKPVDFSNLSANIRIFSRRAEFYRKLRLSLIESLSASESKKFDHIIYSIGNLTDISDSYCSFEQEMTNKIRSENPEVFDRIDVDENNAWLKAFDLITTIYNQCIENGQDLISAFQRQREIARQKGLKYDSVYDEIGKSLKEGKAPTIRHIQSVGNISWKS
ncbi:AIPR family protein [Larkinella rosea]|uniref:Abortive phage infection protein n=1 Tax=Larkinella rosea TaxID=2025312 RepID=A0A3P1C0T6_9BACT|nr:AIPR family protein [Larkinella rosea]RRB06858.1 abortive phage infection protein [Larkinella rosea]